MLLGREEVILRNVPIAVHVFIGSAPQVDELLHNLLFARIRHSETCRISVGLLVFAKMIEAGVTIPRPCGSRGIDSFQITHDFSPGSVQTVEVEPIKSRLIRSTWTLIVVAKPVNELSHRFVPPHPDWKTNEAGKSPFGAAI